MFRLVAKRPFGVSTHLYRAQRLGREQLLEIAAHGFEVIELFASPTHVDFHNPAGIADLQQWLAEAGLTLASVHAPIGAATPEQHEPALFIARRIPVPVFVMHLEGTRDKHTVTALREIASGHAHRGAGIRWPQRDGHMAECRRDPVGRRPGPAVAA